MHIPETSCQIAIIFSGAGEFIAQL